MNHRRKDLMRVKLNLKNRYFNFDFLIFSQPLFDFSFVFCNNWNELKSQLLLFKRGQLADSFDVPAFEIQMITQLKKYVNHLRTVTACAKRENACRSRKLYHVLPLFCSGVAVDQIIFGNSSQKIKTKRMKRQRSVRLATSSRLMFPW